MQTDKLSDHHADHHKPYITKSDFLFLLFASMIVACIAWIGYSIWDDEVRSQTTKENGENLSAWLADKGEKRETENAWAPCDPKTMSWAECRNALVAKDGPFASVKNTFETANMTFAAECDRNQANTLGAIIMQKGTAKPDGSGYTYGPLPDDENLAEPIPMRLSVCSRAFSIVHIKEFVF
jgi:hypothetical protein